MSKGNHSKEKLTQDERQQLRLWLSASPLQRLAWLEEAKRIAEMSGALERYENNQIKENCAEYFSTNNYN